MASRYCWWWFHAGLAFLPGGFIGVDVFFVISGFVIVRMLIGEAEGSGTIILKNFYVRRARRLMPAMELMSLVTLGATALIVSPLGRQQMAAKTAMRASVFTDNLFLYGNGGGYFAAPDSTNPYLHTWSLSVEEQFYFMLPLLFLLVWALARRAGIMRPHALVAVATGLLSAASFALAWLTTHGHTLPTVSDPMRWAFYSPFTRSCMMTKPEMTKKTSTPTYPPLNPTPAW